MIESIDICKYTWSGDKTRVSPCMKENCPNYCEGMCVIDEMIQ